MGRRLNTARSRFIQIIMVRKAANVGGKIVEPKKTLNNKPKITAREILESGPAIATSAGPHFLFLKLLGLKGTGLAQPIINTGAPNSAGKAKSNGRIIEPKGSR